jgi:hypothetical protein
MGFMSALVNAAIAVILALTMVSTASGLGNGGFNLRIKATNPIQEVVNVVSEPCIALVPTEAPTGDPQKEPTQESAADLDPTAFTATSGKYKPRRVCVYKHRQCLTI